MISTPQVFVKSKLAIAETYFQNLSSYLQTTGTNITFCKNGNEYKIEQLHEGSSSLTEISPSLMTLIQNSSYALENKDDDHNKQTPSKVPSTARGKADREIEEVAILKSAPPLLQSHAPACEPSAVCIHLPPPLSSPYVHDHIEQAVLPLSPHTLPTLSASPKGGLFSSPRAPSVFDLSVNVNSMLRDITPSASSIPHKLNKSPNLHETLPLHSEDIGDFNLLDSTFLKPNTPQKNLPSTPQESLLHFTFTLSLTITNIKQISSLAIFFSHNSKLAYSFKFRLFQRDFHTQSFSSLSFPLTLLPKTFFSVTASKQKWEKQLQMPLPLVLTHGEVAVAKASVPLSSLVGCFEPLGPNAEMPLTFASWRKPEAEERMSQVLEVPRDTTVAKNLFSTPPEPLCAADLLIDEISCSKKTRKPSKLEIDFQRTPSILEKTVASPIQESERSRGSSLKNSLIRTRGSRSALNMSSPNVSGEIESICESESPKYGHFRFDFDFVGLYHVELKPHWFKGAVPQPIYLFAEYTYHSIFAPHNLSSHPAPLDGDSCELEGGYHSTEFVMNVDTVAQAVINAVLPLEVWMINKPLTHQLDEDEEIIDKYLGTAYLSLSDLLDERNRQTSRYGEEQYCLQTEVPCLRGKEDKEFVCDVAVVAKLTNLGEYVQEGRKHSPYKESAEGKRRQYMEKIEELLRENERLKEDNKKYERKNTALGAELFEMQVEMKRQVGGLKERLRATEKVLKNVTELKERQRVEMEEMREEMEKSSLAHSVQQSLLECRQLCALSKLEPTSPRREEDTHKKAKNTL